MFYNQCQLPICINVTSIPRLISTHIYVLHFSLWIKKTTQNSISPLRVQLKMFILPLSSIFIVVWGIRPPYSSFVLIKSVQKSKTLLLQHVPCLHVFLSISSFSTSPCFLGCDGWNGCIPSRFVYCDINLIDIFKRWWFGESEKVTMGLFMNRIGPLIKETLGNCLANQDTGQYTILEAKPELILDNEPAIILSLDF